MMKMKLKGYRSGLSRMNLMKLLIVAMALLSQGCVDEGHIPEYRNANREMILGNFERALDKAANNLGEVMKSGGAGVQSDKMTTPESKIRRQQIQSILEPVIHQSAELLKTYGISEDFLEKELGDPDDPRLVLIGVWIARAERAGLKAQHTYQAQLADFAFFFQEITQTEDKPEWMECMLVAVGVDAIIEFAKGNVTEAIAKKAIRKIASRTLGWVGVALALYEYGNCMEWY
jgi:hypothetical protein